MGYGVYEDGDRWAGYMVPGVCDAPGCEAKIDRGLAYKCEFHGDEYDDDGNEVEDVPEGCGLFFCSAHEFDLAVHEKAVAKPDTPEWLAWMLTDESWQEWRTANPERVEAMRADPLVIEAMMNAAQAAEPGWPFTPGDVVRDSGEDGDDVAWLHAAPAGTVVRDPEGVHWSRHPADHAFPDHWSTTRGTQLTSAVLAYRGPLVVVSVGDPDRDGEATAR